MRLAILYPALVLTLAPAMAWADGTDPPSAEALFREGRRAADDGDYATACPKFQESYRLDPAPGTLLSMADCEENRGQLARAWQHFRQLCDQLPATDERKAIADARARALEPRAPKLRIVLMATAPARVTRDDIALGRASLGTSLPVDPGRHLIVVTSPGRRERRYEVSIGEREDKEVLVSSGEPVAATVLSRPHAGDVRAPAEDGSVQRTAAFVLGGVGVASFVAGTIFGVAALSNLASSNAACAGNVCSSQEAVNDFHRAQSFAVAADVTIGVGLAFIGTAIFVALTAPHGKRTARSPPMWIGGRF